MANETVGDFNRSITRFRNSISTDQSAIFQPDSSRYHLYVSWACPWAHRTAIVRSLMGLEDHLSMSVVDPVWNDQGWTFSEYQDSIPDFVNHQKDLIDIYRLADPSYTGDETVPVLWDKKTHTIVNNESLEIIKMFAIELMPLAKNKIQLYPEWMHIRIDEVIAEIYPTINNGVYRVGFATTQTAYERAFHALFQALDRWEVVLGKSRFLCGDELTLADICLFTTLFRFDLVYYAHFKCNQKHLYEYKNLWGFVRDVYQFPGVASTCFPDHIKRHYYMSQLAINPTKIVPIGPVLDFTSEHGRSIDSSA